MHRVLEGIIKSKRLASGYLFMGPPDSSKAEDALAFAERLGCGKLDHIKVCPDGASIKIEQIRELQRLVRYGPSQSDYLLVMIERADEMTDEAAGAFLKTLEEPPPRVLFVLLVERLERLPETVVSRCQKIVFGEIPGAWQPNPEFDSFYADVQNIKGKNILELFELSARLEKERERIEALLYDLVFYAKKELNNIGQVRLLLEAVKNLKKKGNFKLTLEVLCLRMNEA